MTTHTRRQALQRAGVLTLMLQAPQLAFGAAIVGVRIWPAKAYTRLTIESDQPLAARHFVTEGPHRLVVDIDGLGLDSALRDAIIELDGPLGAGKTTFVRHLLRALGVAGRIKSPTYTVVEPYRVSNPGVSNPGGSDLAISHFDFYRFSDAREWHDAGFRDTFANPGLKLAEWPEHARAQLPVPDLRVAMAPLNEHERAVTLQACSPRGLALMA